MARDRRWGDELTLRAASDSYGIVINLVTSEQQHWFLRYEPEQTTVQREIFLTYIAPVHYNAITRAKVIKAGGRGVPDATAPFRVR